MLPASFELIFNGWSHGLEHYIAIFLTWSDEETGYVPERLICCGVHDEDSKTVTSFSADDIGDYIYDELDILGRSDVCDPANNVIEFISADNCETNAS